MTALSLRPNWPLIFTLLFVAGALVFLGWLKTRPWHPPRPKHQRPQDT